MGANVYPEDVEALVYGERETAASVNSFQLAVLSDDSGTPHPGVLLELNDGTSVDEAWRNERAAQFRDGLAVVNRDYQTSLEEFPDAMLPIVQTHPRGTGPFAGDIDRIKHRRIASE